MLEKYVREGQCFCNLQGSSFAMVNANHWKGSTWKKKKKKRCLNFFWYLLNIKILILYFDLNLD
jgi:hypothetical protein